VDVTFDRPAKQDRDRDDGYGSERDAVQEECDRDARCGLASAKRPISSVMA
jgi:hypothetical protein